MELLNLGVDPVGQRLISLRGLFMAATLFEIKRERKPTDD